ncbi:hypothetical protein J3R82DRAFT_1247 [Butyriboletus roseoflavus]|nr:hypothetical protein J3R82DRAFT_1247 [Butyriboletus roseoflavus]
MASDSDSSFVQNEDDDDAEMSFEESDSTDPEAQTDDEETTPLQANVHKSGRKADYLADDLFAAAFASQNSKLPTKKDMESTQQQTVRKRRRKSIARPKDLVIGYFIVFSCPVRGSLIPGFSVVVPYACYPDPQIHDHKPQHEVSRLHALADSWTKAWL